MGLVETMKFNSYCEYILDTFRIDTVAKLRTRVQALVATQPQAIACSP